MSHCKRRLSFCAVQSVSVSLPQAESPSSSTASQLPTPTTIGQKQQEELDQITQSLAAIQQLPAAWFVIVVSNQSTLPSIVMLLPVSGPHVQAAPLTLRPPKLFTFCERSTFKGILVTYKRNPTGFWTI